MREVYRAFLIKQLKISNPPEKLSSLYTHAQVNATLRDGSFVGRVSEGFDIFIIIQIMSDNNPIAKANAQPATFSNEQRRAFEFFNMHCKSIEVAMPEQL